MKKKICYMGNRFGKLTVVGLVPELREKYGEPVWLCKCDCGNEVAVPSTNLRTGNTKSCGCLKVQSQKELRERLHIVDGTCLEWLGGRKSRSDNKSGCKGVFKKKNGTYVVYIGFKKKNYYLGSYADYEEAVRVRKSAEKVVHEEFLAAHDFWQSKSFEDPVWGKAHPFCFEVTKVDGKLVVTNTMSEYMSSCIEKHSDNVTFTVSVL